MSNTSLLGSFGGQVGDALMFRNRIINGDMRIDQRNAGAAVTQQTGALFPVDRFRVLGSVSNKFTAQQNAGAVTPPAGFTHYLGMTSSAATTVGASDYYLLQHNLEGFNVADFGWGTANAQTVSISFWARSSLSGTHSGSFQNNAGDRSYAFTYSIAAANTWEYKTITVPGDTSGTWLKDNGLGIKITWSLGSGSTFLTSAGSWSAGNFFGATGSINVVGTNGATLYITGVQLEAETATPFERRPYSVELGMCQRYYQLNLPGAGYAVAVDRVTAAVTFSTPMRTALVGANLSIVNATGTLVDYNIATRNITSMGTLTHSSRNGVTIDLGSSTTSINKPHGLSGECIAASAEL